MNKNDLLQHFNNVSWSISFVLNVETSVLRKHNFNHRNQKVFLGLEWVLQEKIYGTGVCGMGNIYACLRLLLPLVTSSFL